MKMQNKFEASCAMQLEDTKAMSYVILKMADMIRELEAELKAMKDKRDAEGHIVKVVKCECCRCGSDITGESEIMQ